MRYSRKAVGDELKGFIAGIAIGPGQHTPTDSGSEFKLSKGGVIVPAHANEKGETIDVRDFTVKGEKKPRQYMDWTTFLKADGKVKAVPYIEDGSVNGEIWTGDIDESERSHMLIQSDMFQQGSVAYSGGEVLINALSEAKAKKPGVGTPDPDEAGIRVSKAELLGERQGKVVGGIPLWTTRLWKLRHSATESEAVLVNQLGRFYLVLAPGGVPIYREVPAAKFQRQFVNLTIDQKLIPETAATVAA